MRLKEIDGLTVESYRGEFEEGNDWNPIFPVCFVRLRQLSSPIISAAGEGLKDEMRFALYIGNKDNAFDISEQVWNQFDDTYDIIPGTETGYNAVSESLEFFAHIKSVEINVLTVKIVF